jgi:hypothetical protein
LGPAELALNNHDASTTRLSLFFLLHDYHANIGEILHIIPPGKAATPAEQQLRQIQKHFQDELLQVQVYPIS